MTVTFLSQVNRSLIRAKVIRTPLTSFNPSDSAHKTDIDYAIQAFNDLLDEIYGLDDKPTRVYESSITLATGIREYAKEDNFVAMSSEFPWFINESNGKRLFEYPHSSSTTAFDQMRLDQQIPGDWTGLPNWYAISPITNKFRTNRAPTATEGNGDVYSYQFIGLTVMAAESDTFPCSDYAARQLSTAVTQKLYADRQRGRFDEGEFNLAMSRAAASLSQRQPPSHWGAHARRFKHRAA